MCQNSAWGNASKLCVMFCTLCKHHSRICPCSDSCEQLFRPCEDSSVWHTPGYCVIQIKSLTEHDHNTKGVVFAFFRQAQSTKMQERAKNCLPRHVHLALYASMLAFACLKKLRRNLTRVLQATTIFQRFLHLPTLSRIYLDLLNRDLTA